MKASLHSQLGIAALVWHSLVFCTVVSVTEPAHAAAPAPTTAKSTATVTNDEGAKVETHGKGQRGLIFDDPDVVDGELGRADSSTSSLRGQHSPPSLITIRRHFVDVLVRLSL